MNFEIPKQLRHNLHLSSHLLLDPDFTPQLSVGTSSTVYAAEPIAKYYTKIKKKSTIGG